MLKTNPKYYLICCLFLITAFLVATYLSTQSSHAQPPAFKARALVQSLSPTSKNDLDGTLKSQHPRILLPQLAGLSAAQRSAFFQRRYLQYQHKGIAAYARPCNQNQLSALSSCWLTTNNPDTFKLALTKLINLTIEKPNASSRYGNGWQLALNYDLLASSGKVTPAQHQHIQKKLHSLLLDYLKLLDESSASLWHGRLSLASNAWLCASMLDTHDEERRQLVIRAQHYFLDTARSAAITEAWPEGYSYWINNRGFIFALAASAYINALENSQHSDNLKKLLERIGLWHIYATRPDNKIEGFGDEGPRIDLKDETRRVIDLIASTTGNKQLANYSLYLQKLHDRASYYRHYRWGFQLFNDPALLDSIEGGRFSSFADKLPSTELFGRNASNALYLRSSWHKNATYLTYRAGHNFTHHGHYDAGHFTLFKGQPLAVNSSTYGNYSGENRLNYSLRTIAKNSLLIQRPGEKVSPNQLFKENISAGGQRITLPTGSAIRSTQHWQDNLYQNQHLEGAELEYFTDNANYSFIQSDLTPAYNNREYDENDAGGKVNKVQRSLFYLKEEDILLVRDQVETTEPSYRAKWLLHSLSKPDVASAKVLKGSSENGILEVDHGQAMIREKDSSLSVTTLLPLDATMHLVGGPSYRYYVEVDGDDQTLDGKNMSAGGNDAAWFEKASWRMEIFSPTQKTAQDFLVALAPSLNTPHPIKATRLTTSNNQYGALLGQSAVIYSQSRGQFSVDLPGTVTRLYLIGPRYQPRKLLINDQPLQSVDHSGVITQIPLIDNSIDKTLYIEL